MAIKGNAVGLIASMWVLTGITTAFLFLRLYTRQVMLRVIGSDDVVFILAFVSQAQVARLSVRVSASSLQSFRLIYGCQSDNLATALPTPHDSFLHKVGYSRTRTNK